MLVKLWRVLERTRLRLHFVRVRLLLRAAGVPRGLSPAARERSLEQLRAYARAGRFPRRGGRGLPRPVFVDHAGTHCAVGHLLAINGHAGLVRGIAAERNFAYVRELADTPGLLPALAGLGLTAPEAALIQPVYSEPEIEVAPIGPMDIAFEAALIAFMVGALLLALASVLVASGLLLSARVRHAAWSAGPLRRALTAGVLVAGGYVILSGMAATIILRR